MGKNQKETEKDIEDDSEETPSKNGRGRPKGSKSGARAASFILTHYENKITDRISSPKGASKEEVDGFSADMATDIFIDKHGVKPDIIDGPVYFKNIVKESTSQKKSDSVTVSISALSEIEDNLGEVTYDNWKGTAFSLSGDDKIILFIPKEDLQKDLGRTKPPAKKIIKDIAIFS